MIELLTDAEAGLGMWILGASPEASREEAPSNPAKDIFCLGAFLASPHIQAYAPFGSRVVCRPIPPEADKDYLILVKPEDAWYVSELLWGQYGFYGGNSYPDRYLHSFVLDYQSPDTPILNLVMVTSRLHFDLTMQATAICKEMNLLDKADRIRVHELIEYGLFGDGDTLDPERKALLEGSQ